MCGRIYVRPSAPCQLVLNFFGLEDFELPTLNNVAPTGQIPVIYQQGKETKIQSMRWWLHPSWEKEEPHQKQARFNARIETVQTLNSYRSAVKRQRAIVPMDAFIEWQTVGKTKLPWYIQGAKEPLAVAAIWDLWRGDVFSCAILTQPANSEFEHLHDRMPVSLTLDQAKRWIDPEESAAKLIEEYGHSSIALVERRIDPEANNSRCKNDPVFLVQ